MIGVLPCVGAWVWVWPLPHAAAAQADPTRPGSVCSSPRRENLVSIGELIAVMRQIQNIPEHKLQSIAVALDDNKDGKVDIDEVIKVQEAERGLGGGCGRFLSDLSLSVLSLFSDLSLISLSLFSLISLSGFSLGSLWVLSLFSM